MFRHVILFGLAALTSATPIARSPPYSGGYTFPSPGPLLRPFPPWAESELMPFNIPGPVIPETQGPPVSPGPLPVPRVDGHDKDWVGVINDDDDDVSGRVNRRQLLVPKLTIFENIRPEPRPYPKHEPQWIDTGKGWVRAPSDFDRDRYSLYGTGTHPGPVYAFPSEDSETVTEKAEHADDAKDDEDSEDAEYNETTEEQDDEEED